MTVPLSDIAQPALRARLGADAIDGFVALPKLVDVVSEVLRAHFIQETERTWRTEVGVLRHDYDPVPLEATLVREAGLTPRWSRAVVEALRLHGASVFNPHRFYFNNTERRACLTQSWPSNIEAEDLGALDHFMQGTMRRIEQSCPAALTVLPVGTELWRGRNDEGTLWEEIRDDATAALGTPPVQHAGANRANPAGARCFYGAGDVQTMLSELRTQTGWMVYAGMFRVEREIPILDFETLVRAPLPNPFENDYEGRVRDAGFFRNLAWNFSQSYGPHIKDEVHRSTRFFSDYCRREWPARVHGLRFTSAQRPAGCNVALFADGWGDPSPLRLQSTFTLRVRSRETTYEGVDVLLPHVRPMPLVGHNPE